MPGVAKPEEGALGFHLIPFVQEHLVGRLIMEVETLTHRLILPRDANHHGTLYAGTLLAIALEAGYATAYRAVGPSASLVLKRVLDLRCYEPVPVGRVVEIRGLEVHRARAQVVVALYGTPLSGRRRPWMDSLMQFVQVDDLGRPEALEGEPADIDAPLDDPWEPLRDRARRLLAIRPEVRFGSSHSADG